MKVADGFEQACKVAVDYLVDDQHDDRLFGGQFGAADRGGADDVIVEDREPVSLSLFSPLGSSARWRRSR